MAAEQGRDMGTGRVPGLNTERIYTTTVPEEELAQALADHFRAQGFEAQVFRTSGDRTAMQARKESLWRNLLGVAYALTVVFTPGEGQLTIGLGGHEWVDAPGAPLTLGWLGCVEVFTGVWLPAGWRHCATACAGISHVAVRVCGHGRARFSVLGH
jgi:hypothetical protein